MTSQPRQKPKTDFHARITNENYDFLYTVARMGDMSLARALNRVIEEKRSGTTFCSSCEERVTVINNG